MIKHSNTLGGGGSSTATLPDQISNLVCTGGTDGSQGTIDVSFTEVPATSFDLLKYYILIYKAGSIPQSPFDGTRITLQKATAGAKLEHQITGLTFDQLYGLRIYPVSVKNQFQTLAEGATATSTPVASIRLDSLMADVDVDRIKGIENDPEVQFLVLKHNYENSGRTLVLKKDAYRLVAFSSTGVGRYKDYELDKQVNDVYSNEIKNNIRSQIISVTIPYYNLMSLTSSIYSLITLDRRFFSLSISEIWEKQVNDRADGTWIPYFNSDDRRIASLNGILKPWWTRSPRDADRHDAYSMNESGHIASAPSPSTADICYSRPAFTLPADMLFNPTPDSDGCYIPI